MFGPLIGVGHAGVSPTVQHAIAFTKSCTSPTAIGDPYACSYAIRNDLDEAHDTLTINGLTDVVHAAGGDVGSGNIFGSVQLTVSGGATCTASSGNGTIATPYTGATSCTLPFNSRVDVLSVSHYMVAAADFALPGHMLTDSASLNWQDLCDDPAATQNLNCIPNRPAALANSQTLVQQLASSTATDIHNAAHQVVTSVPVNSTVHDFVTVTGQAGRPSPTGTVTIDWFMNGNCEGNPAATSGAITLDASGRADAIGFAFGPLMDGLDAFLAHYGGDTTYVASDGACEVLIVGMPPSTATATLTPNATRTNTPSQTPTAMGAPLGAMCTSASQCASGLCIDNVCCDRICNAPLEQCNVAPNPGICTSIAAAAPALSWPAMTMALLVLLGIASAAFWQQWYRRH